MGWSRAFGVACLCVLLLVAGAGTAGSTVPEDRAEATVWLGEQSSNGTAVVLESATLPAGGFVAIHATNYSEATDPT